MRQPRIIDTFLFSEPFETELLLAKLTIESPGVAQWVILENEFTFQGEFKGNHLNRILDQDNRFHPFLDRIQLISSKIEFPKIDPNRDVDRQGIEAEHAQRETAQDWLRANLRENDWVMISDTDEILDCTNAARMQLVQNRMAACRSGVLPLPRRRFWYDFDNIWWPRRSTPLVSAKNLANGDSIGSYRIRTIGVPARWPMEIVFEYSFCFSTANIIRKYNSFTHPGIDVAEIESAIACNRTPVAARQQIEISLDQSLWLQPVELNEQNSPEYVRTHLAELKTNVVPSDYLEARIRQYPHLFCASGKLKHFFGQLYPRKLRRRLSRRIQGSKRW